MKGRRIVRRTSAERLQGDRRATAEHRRSILFAKHTRSVRFVLIRLSALAIQTLQMLFGWIRKPFDSLCNGRESRLRTLTKVLVNRPTTSREASLSFGDLLESFWKTFGNVLIEHFFLWSAFFVQEDTPKMLLRRCC